MALTPEQRHQEALAQAQWRVNFRRSSLQTHHLGDQHSQEWQKQEQQLLDDLEQAMRELEKLKKER